MSSGLVLAEGMFELVTGSLERVPEYGATGVIHLNNQRLIVLIKQNLTPQT